MNRGMTFITGLGLGAGLAYILDPQEGNRRRALMRDQAAHALNKGQDAVDATARDLQHRAVGMASELQSRLMHDAPSDERLEARVRSKLGLLTSHPGSITVRVENGRVILSGPILSDEAGPLISALSSVRGVSGIENRLEAHQQADGVPGLQGGEHRPAARWEIMQENWSPATRFLVGGAGLALASYGARHEGLFATAAGLLGLGLIARSATNLPMNRMVGIGAGRRAVDIQKTINIAAPVEQVFEFWNNYENFPRFMRNVREVRNVGEGRSRWTVAGPMGVSVEWEAEITEKVPNEVIAWKSVPGSIVDHAGTVRFKPNPDGTTQVNVRMSYNPPGGALGHVVAALMGADPKSEMDEDLMRMKSLIETGAPPRGAAAESQTQEQKQT